MTSLERMLAAVHGEPFDMYPFINPYPGWSMMPHWPDMLGLTFLHLSHGIDSERLRCCGAFHQLLGLDGYQQSIQKGHLARPDATKS